MTLSEVDTAVGDADPSSVAATILVGDPDDIVLVSVDDAQPVEEGKGATFTVTLSGPVARDVTVNYRTDDGPDSVYGAKETAPDSDYTDVPSGSVTIDAEDLSATITVDTSDAAPQRAEESETFTVTLTGIEVGDLDARVQLGSTTANRCDHR